MDKLIKKYDTAGNRRNYIVVYSLAQDFYKLWKKYKGNIEEKSLPEAMEMELLENNDFKKRGIIVGRTLYKLHGEDQELIHLFVDMSID